MPTVSFSYRSKKETAKAEVRFTYKNESGKRKSFYTRTQLKMSKAFWKDYKKGVNFRDAEKANLKRTIEIHLNDLEDFILSESNKVADYSREWFRNTVKTYYSPKKTETIPTDLTGFIDYYLKTKKSETSEAQRKKYVTIRNKMHRFEKEFGYKILISEIDESFKNRYIAFSNKYKYAQNTQQREFGRIKTICRYARYLGLETHRQLDNLRIETETVKHIYLSPDEIEVIKARSFKNERLENARDWLIISCYTGQRVSDFMRFTKEMIRTENNKDLLEFDQKKTGKLMTIPILKEVREILNKRNGRFPRPISSQKYNDYIKEVCKQCEINEPTKGKTRQCIIKNKNKAQLSDYRRIEDIYPKYELISSHIGRRSFATNYYGKVPTALLKEITGHSTEKMFLKYIQKSNKDLALDAFKYFE